MPSSPIARGQRNLHITLLSADDLKNVPHFGKMHTFAIASIGPLYRHTTPIDKVGGCKPVWNDKFTFTVPSAFFQNPSELLTVEIFHSGTFGNKFVGEANIPLADLHKPNEEQILTYQVKRRSGRVQGSLLLSTCASDTIDYTKSYGAASSSGEPVMAYPPAGYAYGNQGYPQQQGGYPPTYPPQYPPNQAYYPPQGYAPQPYYPPVVQPAQRRPGMGGMGGMGLGTGLLAGALGGLLVGDMIGDMASDNGGYDGGFDGGFDGGGFGF